MNFCPDCGIPKPSDLHTCKEYEQNIELTPDQEMVILREQIGELQAKLSIPEYAQALALVQTVPLATGHSEDLARIAKEIEHLAEQFSKASDGSKYAALDAVIKQLPAHTHGAGSQLAKQ